MKQFKISHFLMWIGFAGVIVILLFPIGTVIGLIIIFWQLGRAGTALHNAKLPGSNATIAEYQKMTEEEKQALADKSNEDFFAKQKAKGAKLKAEKEANIARTKELIAERKAKRGRPRKVNIEGGESK